MIKTNGARQHNLTALNAACVGLLIAYFLHFALPALSGGFGEDEMMNLYLYWLPGAFKSMQANLCFWSTFPRPAGALYYLPLYHFFSLNPLPYRIVQVSILAATIPIFFCFAQLLSWVPCGGVSGRAGNVLSRRNGHAGIYRLFHLRRAVWFLLFRGADCLCLYPRERAWRFVRHKWRFFWRFMFAR
jgi:hypothetical protein